MSVDLLNATGIVIGTTSEIHDPASVIPFMAISCNGTKDGQTFYLRINRGTVDSSKAMYVSYSFSNRIRAGSKAFKRLPNLVFRKERGSNYVSKFGFQYKL